MKFRERMEFHKYSLEALRITAGAVVTKDVPANAIDGGGLYLVTGAAGYLGLTVTKQLIAQGAKVRAFILPNDPARKYLPAEVEVYEGDLTNKESMLSFFTLPEGTQGYVLHIASIVSSNPEWSQRVVDVNVGGTKNIIDLCLATPAIQKMVYCSSTGAIPDQPRGVAIAETNHFDQALVPGCYSQSKAIATQAVLDACKERGLHACVVHPSGIMGPGDYAHGELTQTLVRIVKGELRSYDRCENSGESG